MLPAVSYHEMMAAATRATATFLWYETAAEKEGKNCVEEDKEGNRLLP
jgi:hypothetical protein